MADATLGERLRARGWRMTPQREAVVAALEASSGHVSAEQVHSAVRRAASGISLATVYNTLGALVALGELREVRVGPGPSLFDVNALPHHHFVCDECGRVIDVDRDVVRGLRLPPGDGQTLEVRAVDVVFRGRCGACAAGR